MAGIRDIEILFEDEHLIILNKPAGVLSIGDRFNPSKPNLRAMLRKEYGDIFVVHRLDLETSGSIVYAKSEEVHRELSLAFENQQVEKIYHAICLNPRESSGSITEPIMESSRIRGHYVVHRDGKSAVTHYKVLKTWGTYSLLECHIETGRTHQIRVHMKHIGAPLLVDDKYGVSNNFYLSAIRKKYKRGKFEEETPLVGRSTLHARTLAFLHPVINQHVAVTAEYPKDIRALIYQFDKNLRALTT